MGSVRRVARDPEETYSFTAQVYRSFKAVAVGFVALLSGLVGVAALKVTISPAWLSVNIPLWLVVLGVGLFMVGACVVLVACVTISRNALGAASYFRSNTKTLRASLRDMETLAYIDPITGIPNSNGLRRELVAPGTRATRVLILLDLVNFRLVNKRFNHWHGDAYLRSFAQAITEDSRRSEYIYKRREGKPQFSLEKMDAKAFRKAGGSDEFFVLLNGDVSDALGYLNRLHRRRSEFEQMSIEVLGGVHEFRFRAGIVPIAQTESYESAVERASACLQLASDPKGKLDVFWPSESVSAKVNIDQAVLAAVERNFAKGIS